MRLLMLPRLADSTGYRKQRAARVEIKFDRSLQMNRSSMKANPTFHAGRLESNNRQPVHGMPNVSVTCLNQTPTLGAGGHLPVVGNARRPLAERAADL
jgi:hypothetical protein